MVPLAALWLPILLSAVIVFVASSIMHMVLPYHHSDYSQLPDEDKILATLRTAALKRGLYVFPFCTHKDMKSPALIEKQKQGPVGFLTIVPSGPPAMPKFSDPVVCVLPLDRILCRTSHVSRGSTRRKSSGRLSRGPYRCVSRLRFGAPEQRHLERTDVGDNYQGSYRRTRLWFADRRDLWLALAAIGPRREWLDEPRSPARFLSEVEGVRPGLRGSS